MLNLPKDFADALKAAKLADFFSSYAPSHKNEHLKWIAEAKKPETRKARIAKTIAMLSVKAKAKGRAS